MIGLARVRLRIGAAYLGVAIVASSAASGCAGGWRGEPARTAQAVVPARVSDLEVIATARGELEALQESPIAVPQVPTGSLKVKQVIPEGENVRKGDIILVFDETTLELEIEGQDALFRSADRRIDRTRIQWAIESGAISVDKAVAALERDYASSFDIEDEAIYTRLEILESTLGKLYAEEKIVFADAKLLLRGEYFDIDERILDVERKQSSGKIDRARASLAQLVLQAPLDGMVVYRKNWRGTTVSTGDTLWPGNVVLAIVDPTRVALKVFILEKDAAGIVKGTAATVRVDALPDRVFPGKVLEIANLSRPIEEGNPAKYFEAKIEMDKGDAELLKPGLRGEARIQVASVPGVVVVPRAAVRGGDKETYVLVEGASGAEKRPVELGAGDLVRVSVLKGLSPEDSVIVSDEAAVEPRPSGNGTDSPGSS